MLELMAVVVILGIIALVVIPRINFSSTTTKENACFQNKAELNTAVEKYYWDNGSLPADINALDVATYFPDGLPKCPVTDADYALDATTKRVTGHTAGSH